MTIRCAWCGDDPLYQAYHDAEWGIPVRDDRLLFEFLMLEGMQAGLSWITILRKRENFRRAFDGFDPARIAQWDDTNVQALMGNPGIVRNRAKILATIGNARAMLQIQAEFADTSAAEGGFSRYLWQFVDGNPIIRRPLQLADVPASTPVSDAMSKDLKKRGFRFVGTTICYAFMQAVGMVCDHTTTCFCHPDNYSHR